jgi:hypothetical protein
VATPYLDEAERCHRIAFMHLGEILQIGTPTELCASLGAKRIELRTADLRKAEVCFPRGPGRIRTSSTFSGSATGSTCWCAIRTRSRSGSPKAEGAGLSVDEMRVDEPTLENTFVNKLRALSQKADTVEFPAKQDHSSCADSCGRREESRQRVQIIHGCEECEPRDSKRRSIRTSRSERGGQDNNHPDALRAAGPDKRNHGVGWHRWKPENGSCTQAHRLHVAEVLFV